MSRDHGLKGIVTSCWADRATALGISRRCIHMVAIVVGRGRIPKTHPSLFPGWPIKHSLRFCWKGICRWNLQLTKKEHLYHLHELTAIEAERRAEGSRDAAGGEGQAPPGVRKV